MINVSESVFMRNRGWVIILFVAVSLVLLAQGREARAGTGAFGNITLPQGLEKEEIVLTVKGKIGKGPVVQFDMKTIEMLPRMSFTTYDPWDSQDRLYEGVRLSDLLRFLEIDSSAKEVEVHARNDYQTVFSVEDLDRIGYLLAYRMDGEYFNKFDDKRNKGPLAIAIDFNTKKEIDVNIYKHNMVWWIDVIRVR